MGEFPAGDHSITGTVQFTSPTTVVIDDLSFDGNAPGKYYINRFHTKQEKAIVFTR